MNKSTVYVLPLNPMPLLNELAGASFLVSYASRKKIGRQLNQAIDLVGQDGILIIDNGAYSMWEKGGQRFDDATIDAFETWACDILDRCPQAIVVIPDVIGGTEEENRELLNLSYAWDHERSMPIWHMHEPIQYLLDLCESYNYVGIGSTSDAPGTPAWHARIKEAFAAIDAWEAGSNGAFVRPRIHMMRAQAQAHLYDFDSSDSSNVAMNHGRYRKEGQGHVARLAGRIDAKIQASCDQVDADHQVKRPLLDHIENARVYAELAALPNLAATQNDDTPPTAPIAPANQETIMSNGTIIVSKIDLAGYTPDTQEYVIQNGGGAATYDFLHKHRELFNHPLVAPGVPGNSLPASRIEKFKAYAQRQGFEIREGQPI